MIYDVGDHEGQPFIAMEFIQGQTLSEVIRQRMTLPTIRKLELMSELCDGLGFAHKAGVIHRDIKPANVMVDHEGLLKILDFGIARVAESTGMTQAGMLIASLNYMSPEQVTGQPVDSRSDIFAVGAVYELLAYRQAFPRRARDRHPAQDSQRPARLAHRSPAQSRRGNHPDRRPLHRKGCEGPVSGFGGDAKGPAGGVRALK
jgi:serine/threonine protein kinase